MLRCDWRYVAASIGLVLAVTCSGIWVYYLDNPIAEQARASENNTPSDKVSSRLERVARSLEAIEKGVNSQQNEERARRDLDAQEGAWRWAKWAVWVAAVQAILSGVGIAFVALSLRQGQAGLAAARHALRHAKSANVIAQKIGEAQTRAYLSITDAKFTIPEKETSKACFVVRNFGNSPALGTEIRLHLAVVANGKIAARHESKHAPNPAGFQFGTEIAAQTEEPFNILVPQEIERAIRLAADVKLLSVDMVVTVKFTDVFDNEIVDEQFWIALIGSGINPTPMARVGLHTLSISLLKNPRKQE